MADDPTMDDLYSALDMPAPTDPPPADPPTDPPPADPPADPPPTDLPPADPATPPANDADIKAQQAFIHMRQQNSQMKNLLKGVAGMLGLSETDAADEQKLADALQNKILTHQAEIQKVPPELLQRLNTLEQREQTHLVQQRQQEMAVGLQQLQTKFNLTQQQLTDFAAELVNSGVNPLTQQVNMIKEYQTLHFEDIIKAREEAAIKAEQARSAKAATQSSTPNPKRGDNPDAATQKVNSVRQLDEFFKSMKT